MTRPTPTQSAQSEAVRDGVQCPFCSRSFADELGRWEHAKRNHRGEKLAAVTPERIKARDRAATAAHQAADAKPETYADMAIEAQWRRDAGLPVPEDIAWLIP